MVHYEMVFGYEFNFLKVDLWNVVSKQKYTYYIEKSA